MKYPHYATTGDNNMEKMSAAAESKMHHLKASPVKEHVPFKPHCPPAEVATVLFSPKINTSTVHNKENNTIRDQHERTLEEGLEDSGYLSLQSSQVEAQHVDEDDNHIFRKPSRRTSATHLERRVSPINSPSKCQVHPVHLESRVGVSTPEERPRRNTAMYLLSSTPSRQNSDPNLPILKFEKAVCEKLAESFRKTNKYDWSIVSKIAEDHLLDRVAGRQMGVEYIDMFSSLLARNMKSILTNILTLLGDMDLISCKMVSRTWRKIICEDTAALSRCQQAERALRESKSSLRSFGLTRDMVSARVVLSCMQTLATSSSTTPTSSTSSKLSCGRTQATTSSQRGIASTSKSSRLHEFMQAASTLKQNESLRPCKRCGSPATHSAEVQRAVCTRLSCLFEFCTRCREAFHGSTPCRIVQPRDHPSISKMTPGARSKRNVRRL